MTGPTPRSGHGLAEPWHQPLLALWEQGQRLSAVGPGPVQVHLDHSLALAGVLDPPAFAVDLGSGAGIPGLALAGQWPETQMLLIDAAARRARFLARAVAELGWSGRVTVVHGRAEDLGRDRQWRGRADLVTARAFGPPATTAECGAPFLRVGGLLVVTDPPDGFGVDDRWPVDGLAKLGMSALPRTGAEAISLRRLRLDRPLRDEIPRRAGVPERRPLF